MLEDKLIKRRISRKMVRQLTDGLLGTVVDLTLFSLFLPLSSIGKAHSSRGVYEAFKETDETLANFNYKAIKRTLNKLREEGLIESFKNWVNEPILTQAGTDRLRQVLPKYYKKRPWSRKLYLINYDVSLRNNRERNLLRSLLLKLGGIKLQNSLYLTVNNSYKFIEEFKKEYSFEGTILVSELSQRNFIGEEDLKSFIWKIAKLDLVNDRYRDFINKWKNRKEKISKTEVALEYYSILKDDPQLPFEVLLDDYLGDEAYFLLQRFIKKSL
ncbi:hypothetical protein HZB97_00090 [Candidatus Gottesmanbacteria bacterium]|nr:hypothetical protein [Candidatus Gottesmanbacteria bacterium]MBI5465157.1 hypothetical protein [Candidatus Gottesmanbacteria bacterium]